MQRYAVSEPVLLRWKIIRRFVCTAVRVRSYPHRLILSYSSFNLNQVLGSLSQHLFFDIPYMVKQ